MSNYKPTGNLNQVDTVRLISLGQQKTGNYGPYYQSEVVVNGENMQWSISEDKKNQLFEAGFKEGDTFKITKWREGDKRGYNFESTDKSNPYSQPEHPNTPPPPTQEVYNEKPPVNQAGRGQCLNLGALYTIYKACGGTAPFHEWINDIKTLASTATTLQANFVNGE